MVKTSPINLSSETHSKCQRVMATIYADFLHLIRNSFLNERERRTTKQGDLFFKVYSNLQEARYEYEILKQLRDANPKTFTVPQPLKLVEGNKQTTLVMERVKGSEIQFFLNRFFLFGDKSVLRLFNSLGNSLLELNSLELKNIKSSNLPTCYNKLRGEVTKLATKNVYESILDRYNLDRKFFDCVTLHGEFYFSHILLSKGKFVFLDFHNSCSGPAFYDLATFIVSLHSSLLLPFASTKNIESIMKACLEGYLKRKIQVDSFKVAELYITLQVLSDIISKRYTTKDNLVESLKKRKLKKMLENIRE